MDKTETSPSKSKSEDDSITTSTESDTFDTWTLVTDKRSKQKEKPESDLENRIEELQEEKNKPLSESKTQEDEDNDNDADSEEQNESKPDQDDLSDGISIISESESAGRVTPHPFLQEHLQNINLKFSTGNEFDPKLSSLHSEITPPLSPMASNPTLSNKIDNQIRQRRRRRSSTSTNSDIATKALQATNTVAVEVPSQVYPIVKRGMTAVFYVGLTLAVLAFLGKLRYPEWEPLATNKPITDLEQKLTDIELQNNLMRAEIDILSKQVKFLSTLNEDPSTGHQRDKRGWEKDHERKGKTFKAWPGNGKVSEPVDITKNDLKRPYKCPDGKFVEIAGMCMDQNVEEILDNSGNAANNILEESETYKAFEKVAEKLNVFAKNPFKEEAKANVAPSKTDANTPTQTSNDEAQTNKNVPRKYHKEFNCADNSDEHGRAECKMNLNEANYRKPHKHHDDDDDDDDDDNDDDDDDDDSKEHIYKRLYNSKERFYKNDKHQHFDRDNSKEHYEKKQRFDKDNSKEHFDRLQRKGSSGERFRKDGHWHEKLMNQREKARHKNERQRNGNNWFIERGDNREQLRFVDTRYR